ncbi:MAG: type I-E CRISPR-associated protein Cse2/CasB [Leptospirales bacterium]
MKKFIEWLEGLNEKDTRVRAVLRRSLAFEPGKFVPAYPYVEPFLKDENNTWLREVFYLVAGLWAVHWREGRSQVPMSIGKACAVHQETSSSKSTERRFITMLDADSDQLPYRLRQIISLLKEIPIDFDSILVGLQYWNDNQKRTQNTWARDFYQNLDHKTTTGNQIEMEIIG